MLEGYCEGSLCCFENSIQVLQTRRVYFKVLRHVDFFLQEVVAFSFWASVDTVLYTLLVYTVDFILRETRN